MNATSNGRRRGYPLRYPPEVYAFADTVDLGACSLTPDETRSAVVELAELMSSAELQLKYAFDVPHVRVAIEIVEMFCSNNFHPKSKVFFDAFNESEHKLLARLYGDACRAGDAAQAQPAADMREVLKIPAWRMMMETAKIVHRDLARR